MTVNIQLKHLLSAGVQLNKCVHEWFQVDSYVRERAAWRQRYAKNVT